MEEYFGPDNYKAYVATPAPDQRYDSSVFRGVLIDTGAAKKSTAGIGQMETFIAKHGGEIDNSTAGAASIVFGTGGSVLSIGSVNVETPFGAVIFHVLPSTTPFLLSLADMDRHKVYFDNTKNAII